MPYFLRFPDNSSIIDIEKIIKFYDDVFEKQSESYIISEIRDYAIKYVGMDKSLGEVVQYVEEE